MSRRTARRPAADRVVDPSPMTSEETGYICDWEPSVSAPSDWREARDYWSDGKLDSLKRGRSKDQ